MNTPHMTLVITTINVPTLLEEYADNFEKYGHLEHTSAIIIGDRKTPHDAVEQAVRPSCATGASTACTSICRSRSSTSTASRG